MQDLTDAGEENLGFKPGARLEQVGEEHSKAMEDRKHRVS